MKSEWEGIFLKTEKIRGSLEIVEVKEYWDMLDRQIVESRSAAEKGEAEAEEWSKILVECSDIMEELEKFQRRWMYIVPIFENGESIQKSLPKEYAKLQVINKIWKGIIDTVQAGLKVIDLCKVPGLLQKLKENGELIDAIQNSLALFLDEIRNIFPRFYFLSNDELLGIISIQNFLGIRPYINKIFSGDLEIVEDSLLVEGMVSCEGERLKFKTPVESKGKKVFVVLKEIEEMMKLTIRESVERGLTTYKEKASFLEWVVRHEHLAQSVHVVCSIEWTREVEKRLHSVEELSEYRDQMNREIEELCESVKNDTKSASRELIGYILVRHVRRKDVVEYLMGVADKDLMWRLQFRTYWEQGHCYSRCLECTVKHAYEYIGNPPPLVRTPLTHRAYINIMTARKLGIASYPAGPAGVGKTETTRELSRDLQTNCVVVNCSDQMDYMVISKFLKGIAILGAWIVFDEFNRINPKQLENVSEQLTTLFTARANQTYDVEFQGKMTLDPIFHVCFTCNPGYAGRTEMPYSLEKLAIRCPMMIPDYALISEINLYALGGFKSANILGGKLVLCFKLCSEQLSLQDHYDYGMRAVQASIRLASQLHRDFPEADEEQLLLEALVAQVKPSLVESDIPIFQSIIFDLFQKPAKITLCKNEVTDAIKLALKEQKLDGNEMCIEKVSEICRKIEVYNGVGVVGQANSGKITNIRVAGEALGKLTGSKVHLHILQHNTMTIEESLGFFTPNSKVWKDGKFSEIFRSCSNDQGPDSHWIVLDGKIRCPEEVLLFERLNTILDDHKMLYLPSGECIPLTANMRIILKTLDFACASPATVSRLGLIYQEPLDKKSEKTYPEMVIMDKIDFKELSSKVSKPTADLSPLEEQFLGLLTKYDAEEVECFLNKHQKFPPEPIPPVPYEWMDQLTFQSIYTQFSGLKQLPAFKDIDQKLKLYEIEIRNIYEAEDPSILELPAIYEGKLNEFERLMLMKILRPDKLLDHIQNFVSSVCGGKLRGEIGVKGFKSFKENILEAYECIDHEELKHKDPKVVVEYRRLIFGLLYLQGVVLERLKYGRIGWNVGYKFGLNEVILSQRVMKYIMEGTEKGVPLELIQYIIGEICYGGTINDDKDRTCMRNLVSKFISPEVLVDREYNFSHSPHFYIPQCAPLTLDHFQSYLQVLPQHVAPQLAGLSTNPQITSQLYANRMLQTISAQSPTSFPVSLYFDAIDNCKIFDIKLLQQKFPPAASPFNIILIQELTRLNKIINIMRESMTSAKVSKVANDIFNNTIPQCWKNSYPIPPLPLSTWLIHFQKILKFFTDWTEEGIPVAFWLPGNIFIYIYIL